MNKKVIFLLFLVFLTFSVYAEKVICSPVVIYDENNQKITLSENPSKKIVRELHLYYLKGLIDFEYVSENKYGYVNSVIDAERICTMKDTSLIVYGFVQKREMYWYANLKMYNSNNKKVVKEFFASDDKNNYDRFIISLEKKIVAGFQEMLGLDPKDEFVNHRPLEWRFGTAGYYWTPISKDWASAVLGIAGGSLSVEVFPPLKNNVVCQKMYDFSFKLKTSYSYAMNRQKVYPFEMHNITVSLPFVVHLYFDEHNSIYAGAALFYECELLKIQENYKDAILHYQTMFGPQFILGYELSVNDIFKMHAGMEFDFHFSDDKYAAIRPELGMEFSIYKSKEKKK